MLKIEFSFPSRPHSDQGQQLGSLMGTGWMGTTHQTNKRGNRGNMEVWLNHSRYPSVDMATDFTKEQYAGVHKSFYDYASRYYGIDNLLAGSTVNPSTFKSLSNS